MTVRATVLASSILLAGCFYVTERERAERWDLDGDGLERPLDCDDADARQGGERAWYQDADGDGFGAAATETLACDPGQGWVTEAGDCDDADGGVFPGAVEQCDDRDDDCDLQVDEDLPTSTFYADEDGDGYGDEDAPVERCGPGEGFSDLAGDCDDALPEVSPEALEVCNDGLDDDCDGDADDDDPDFEPPTWYEDLDLDGHGGVAVVAVTCVRPPDAAPAADDCDDASPDVYPGAEERCNGRDDDCDLAIDDGAADMLQYYQDADDDGFGDGNQPVDACPPDPPATAPDGLATNASDCDDGDAGVNPAATECIDGVDNDCDSFIDESGC